MTTTVKFGERIIASAETGALGLLKFAHDSQLAAAALTVGADTLRIFDRTDNVPPISTVLINKEDGIFGTVLRSSVKLTKDKQTDALQLGMLRLVCSIVSDQPPPDFTEVPAII